MDKIYRKNVLVLCVLCLFLAGAFFIMDMSKNEDVSATTKKPQTKVFHLYAGDMEQEMSQGTTLYAWGFGLWDPKKKAPSTPPSVPGPEIRVNEGDHVKVVFHNRQKELHTIHFHGIDNSFEGDGTPGMSQHATKQTDSFTYEFDADHPGTYWYHCHVEPDRHPEMGLHGAVIVEPKKPSYKTDGEFTLILSERDPLLSLAEGSEAHQYVGTAAEHLHLDGDYDSTNRKAKYFTINGKVDPEIPPIHVKKGGKYLIRLINAGSEVHTFHTHGHHFKIVASDGRDFPKSVIKDSVTIGPGEKYDLLLTANNPGIWPVHCHMGPHSTHGMHMMMVYDSYHDSMEHGTVSPMGKVKHQLAVLKQYEYEKKYDLMKPEIEKLEKSLNGFYNNVAAEHYEEWSDLDSTAIEISNQLKGKVNPVLLNKSMNVLEGKINTMEQILQGGDLS